MPCGETEMHDQFAYIIELCHISSSQEQILRHFPFAGQRVNSPDDGASPSPGEVPVASAGIVMETLPETAQDAGRDRSSQDDFHTPPEQQSSLSSSDLPHCAMHKAVETGDETQGFVDLSDDSELGFPQVKLKQRIDPKFVVECSSGNNGATVSENSNCEPKLVSNPKSPCNFGAHLQHEQNVQIGKEMCLGIGEKENTCGRMPVEKNSGSFESLGKFNLDDTEECVENSQSREGICEAEKLQCTGEGDVRTAHGVSETSEVQKRGDKQQELHALPSSIHKRLGNEAKEKEESGKGLWKSLASEDARISAPSLRVGATVCRFKCWIFGSSTCTVTSELISEVERTPPVYFSEKRAETPVLWHCIQ